MKRLLSLILALSLLGSLALPAVAEEAGEFAACAVSEGCVLTQGHTEPCKIPEQKVCQTGCLLEAGHEGDCRTETSGNEGIMPIAEDEGVMPLTDPAPDRVLKVFSGGDYVTELSAEMGDPPLSVQFFYFGTGEAPLVLDDSATFAVTDLNGNPTGGVVMEKNPECDSLYTITFASAAPYKLVCTLDGEVIGSVNFYVNSRHSGSQEIPMGLSMKVESNGSVGYCNGNGAFVGQPAVYQLYYNGEEILDPEAPFIYDKTAIRLEKLNWGWEITALVPGEHAIDYEGNTYSYITIFAEERESLNVDNPPSDLQGLYFCWLENGKRKWGNNISVSGSFSATLVLVKDGMSTIVKDGDRVTYSPAEGMNRRFDSSGVLEIQPGGKAGRYTVTYTDTDGSTYSLNINYGMNLNNPPPDLAPGMYFCWNQNGQMSWNNHVSFSGQFGGTLALVQEVDGQNVATPIKDVSKLSVSPSTGLNYTVFSDGICKLEGVKGGEYTLTYTLDATTQYKISVSYDDGTVNLADAPTVPGLYHVIYDNKYFFTGNKNVSMTNGSGRTSGPLVLVDDKCVATQLTDPDLLDTSSRPYLTVSPASGMTLSYDAGNLSWVANVSKPDLYTITYVAKNNKTYSTTLTISNSGKLYASVDGGQNWMGTLYVTEDEPVEVEFAWINSAGRYVKTLGSVHGSNDQVHITRNMNTGISTLVVDNPNVNANATYVYDDYNTYMMKIISQEAYRLALKADGSQTPVYDYIGEVDAEIPVELLFGQPSSGLNPLDVTPVVSAGLSLEADNGTGLYKLKILKEGKHTISFTHTCTAGCPSTCTASGKTYTVNVEGIPKGSGGNFFALKASSSTPNFVSEMLAGETQRLRLCYGSFGNYQVLTASQLKVGGDAVTIRQNGDAVDVVYNRNGQALIQYVDGEGITHNYVVKCYTGMEEMSMAHYSEQGHNTVNLDYKGKTITVGPALRTEEEMWMWPGNSFNHTAAEDWDIHDEVVIGAMYAGEGNSVTEPADASFFDRIRNINMRIMYCENTVTNPGGEYNVTIESPESVSWKGRTLQMQKFQGKKGLYFEADLMISYDVDMGKGSVYRFYSPADLSYRAVPDDKIAVDITDADVLNTLLSNSYTLINYLEANVEGFKYGGGNLTLTLPAVTYDKVLVSQLILPGSVDVLGVFTIEGSEANGQRTTVPGIYSKGFLHGVNNISFVANPDAAMTFDGETFTCGLLVNNTRNAIQPEFHKETLQLYHPEFMGLVGAELDAKFASYSPSVSTNGNSYNIGRVSNCSFTGFEYAMRTDKGGFVQGAHGCTIRQCKFGVYINAGNVETLHTDGRANTIWRDNEFIENWAAVRITGLPKDLSPYYIRFIDNNFYRNNKEFWVTARGQYYFYRNYYSGHWNAQYWQDFWEEDNGNSGKARMLLAEGTGAAARAASMTVDTDTVLVTNPCRSKPGSSEDLWIFDTDELQKTVILQSEAASLKVDSGAIMDLGEELEIPVLNDREDTVGTWSIYEGGDTQ